jgi:hypothetical protein
LPLVSSPTSVGRLVSGLAAGVDKKGSAFGIQSLSLLSLTAEVVAFKSPVFI